MNHLQNTARFYEVHCTIGSQDGGSCSQDRVDAFRQLCSAKGIKTIVYENGVPVSSTHVMTSTKARTNEEAQTAMATITAIAAEAKVAIIRRKIETSPRPTDIVTGKDYFELHVTIQCEDISKVPFDHKLWSISRNVEKPVGCYTLTMRGHKTDYKAFRKKATTSMKSFAALSVEPDKLNIERCIFDDNTELDYGWMGKNA